MWTSKYRYRILQVKIDEYVENKIRAICDWKKAEILELNVMTDHVHMVVIVPLRTSISNLMGYLKGKTAIAVFQKAKSLKV